jgi:endonuclease YncB( thermonuclease family)
MTVHILIVILTIILLFFMVFPNFLTDSLSHIDGCHRWHSCPSDDGSYVCGDLGYNDECGGGEDGGTDKEEDTELADDDITSSDNDSNRVGTESGGLLASSDSGNDNGDNDNNQQNSSPTSSECRGQADCFTGIVTEIIDGDTLDINNVRVRLSLVDTPERGDSGYQEAKDFTESTCLIGSKALVDEDDGQKEGSFDRLIGLVYCGNEKLLLNELLLNKGHAKVFDDFCGISEFSEEGWVQKFGC